MSTSTNTLTPQTLAKKLLGSGISLEELLAHFAADTEFIASILYSQQFNDHLKLRVDLAIAQTKLQAVQNLPLCINTLLDLTNPDNPEVARRSIMAIMAIAGLPTRPVPAPAAPSPTPPQPATGEGPPPEPTPPNPTSSNNQLDHRSPEQRERDERQKHRDDAILDFHRDLYISRGIDLLKITQLNFHGFADHLQAFFQPAGITFARNDGTPFDIEKSIHHPDVVARAQAYFNQHAPHPDPTITPDPTPKTNQNPDDSALFCDSP